MSRTIIALIGPKGFGKSTLAHSLGQKGFKTASFASPLKNMIATLFLSQGVGQDAVGEMIFGSLKEEPTPFLAGRTPRYAMQTLGTEWRDLISRTLWTEIWLNTYRGSTDNLVVDDMRFQHEAEAVRQLGGHILRVHREHYMPPIDNHISEREFLSIDYDRAIVNYDGRPEAMLQQVLDYLREKGQ